MEREPKKLAPAALSNLRGRNPDLPFCGGAGGHRGAGGLGGRRQHGGAGTAGGCRWRGAARKVGVASVSGGEADAVRVWRDRAARWSSSVGIEQKTKPVHRLN